MAREGGRQMIEPPWTLWQGLCGKACGGPCHIENSLLICSKSVYWFLYDRDLRHERVS